MKQYTIDVEAIDGYIRYLKEYRHLEEAALKEVSGKLAAVHDAWDDVNYVRTEKAMGEIKEGLDALFVSFREAVESLGKMTKGYKEYLSRRRN